jgi:hypothetical protein
LSKVIDWHERQASLGDIDKNIRTEEREKRRAFVERTRESILQIMGYPYGLPTIKARTFNSVLAF